MARQKLSEREITELRMHGTWQNRNGIKLVKLLMDRKNQIALSSMVFSMIMCLMWILEMVCLSGSCHTTDQIMHMMLLINGYLRRVFLFLFVSKSYSSYFKILDKKILLLMLHFVIRTPAPMLTYQVNLLAHLISLRSLLSSIFLRKGCLFLILLNLMGFLKRLPSSIMPYYPTREIRSCL
uniref:Transmembrane protein n=1 Tax=Medicago truncatula TaxID=3880 RepID=I3SPN3_MEDTR|nr:unknown [Medicago truncatula]